MELEQKLKEAFDGQKKLWEGYKAEVGDEIKKLNDEGTKLSTDAQEKISKMETDFGKYEKTIDNLQTKIKADNEAGEQKMKDLEAKLNRPRGGRADKLSRKDFITDGLYKMAIEPDAEEKAVAVWDAIKSGIPSRALPEEHKALTFADPETGGYLGTPEFVNDMIKELRETTPVMSIAKVRTTSANSIVIPKKTGTISASRRGESEAKTEATGLTYGSEQVVLPEMYAFLDVTEMDLEDTMFNLEGEIKEEIGDAFTAKLGAEFITGSGPLQLEGLLTNPDVGSTSSGSNSVLQPDELITFVESALKQQYKVNGKLMFNLSTLAAIRILQVPTVGGYVWAPGFEKTPSTIFGKPYIVSEDMPDIAQNAFPIIYADYKKGYTVGLRVRIGIKRITDSTLDAAGTVRFSGRMRVGGKVTQSAAIKKHKIST